MREFVERWPRERLAERVTAAAYGTILVLASLALLDDENVSSGLGWELVTGVGLATWIAHLYAEVVGDHLRHGLRLDWPELRRGMVDGLPILLAAVAPAIVLGLGRLDVLDPGAALWISVAVGFVQLVGVGVLVGVVVSSSRVPPWRYAAVTALVGLVVVAVKLGLSH
jgi:hypothetical protein